MKRITAVFIVCIMLVSTVVGSLTVSASGTEEHPYGIASDQTEIVIGGQTYKVIRTVEDFVGMALADDATSTYYILAGDLDFSEKEAYTSTLVPSNLGYFSFEGNGYSIIGLRIDFKSDRSAIFSTQASCAASVRNLTVNVSGSVSGANCGILFSTPESESGMNLYYSIENVTINADLSVSAGRFGGFVCDIKGKVDSKFTDCTLKGRIDASAGTNGTGDIGGFVSKIDGARVVFENCYANPDVFTVGQVSGCFVSNVTGSAAVVFNKCAVNGVVNAKNRGVGGYIGYAQTTSYDGISFYDCSVDGAFTRSGGSNTFGFGGYIGNIQNDGTRISFEKCISKATMTDTEGQELATLAGFISVFTNKKAHVTFTDCINVGTVMSKKGTNSSSGFIGESKNAAASISFVRCLNAGESKCAFINGDAPTSSFTVTDCVAVDSIGTDNGAAKVTTAELASGKAAYLLIAAGGDFGQRLGTEAVPVLGGENVNCVVDGENVTYVNGPKEDSGTAPEIDWSETVDVNGATYYVVRTVEQFEAMSGSNKYILGCDIDFGGKVYDHVVIKNHFYGILDGNKHSITNFTIDSITENSGIFETKLDRAPDTGDADGDGNTLEMLDTAYVYTVKNLTVGSAENYISVSGSGERVGVLAGSIIDGAAFEISGVTIYADVEAENNGYAGGFFGRVIRTTNKKSSFTDCSFYGSVNALHSNVGGFIGRSATNITFKNCKNFGDIGEEGSSSNHVGGFVGNSYEGKYCKLEFTGCENNGSVKGAGSVAGFVGTANYNVYFVECINNGEVAASASYAAGFIGKLENPSTYVTGVTLKLQLCENKATISSTSGESYVGGLVGAVMANLIVEKSTNSGAVSGGQAVGGLVGYIKPTDTSVSSLEEGKRGERYTVKINGAENSGAVTLNGTVAGCAGGIIGATSADIFELTLVIDSATNKSEVKNAGSLTDVSYIGGIIGRFGDSDGSMTVSNCHNAGAVVGNGNDIVAGILGYTSAALDTASTTQVPITRTVESCLNTGIMSNGGGTSNIYAIAYNAENKGSLINCYVPVSAAYELGGFGEGQAKTFNEAQIASGELAYLLGAGFGQELGKDEAPYVGGNPVVFVNGGYYNSIHTHIMGDNPYVQVNAGKHARECTICGEMISEAHKFGEYEDMGDGTHTRHCSLCTYSSAPQTHTYGEETDICTVCGATQSDTTEAAESTDKPAEPNGNSDKGIYKTVIISAAAVIAVAAAVVVLIIAIRRKRTLKTGK